MLSPASGRFPHLFPDSRRLTFAESERPDIAQNIGSCGRAAFPSAAQGQVPLPEADGGGHQVVGRGHGDGFARDEKGVVAQVVVPVRTQGIESHAAEYLLAAVRVAEPATRKRGQVFL